MVKGVLRYQLFYWLTLAVLLHMTVGLPIDTKIPKEWKAEWKKAKQKYFDQSSDGPTVTADTNQNVVRSGEGTSPLPAEVRKKMGESGIPKPFDLKK